ncbi:MAG: tripartite tricarboxylate transporter TctB family protein [Aestuariivirgaceae bacterium]|nr:tripartite tricarboxylate transporter TctB family protein [Aestuariivirgaceae bacterium]
MKAQTKVSGAGLTIGLGFLALAAILALDAATMQVPPNYARVGPQVFPYIVASGMGLCGLRLIWEALRDAQNAHVPPVTDWKAVLVIGLALASQYFLLKPLGFVFSALVLFMAITHSFGSHKYARDVLVGLVLALAAYTGFRYGLGIALPPGLLKGLL